MYRVWARDLFEILHAHALDLLIEVLHGKHVVIASLGIDPVTRLDHAVGGQSSDHIVHHRFRGTALSSVPLLPLRLASSPNTASADGRCAPRCPAPSSARLGRAAACPVLFLRVNLHEWSLLAVKSSPRSPAVRKRGIATQFVHRQSYAQRCPHQIAHFERP